MNSASRIDLLDAPTPDSEACGPSLAGAGSDSAASSESAETLHQLPWKAFAALICVPLIWVASLVYQYGVNVPHFDQWIGMAPLFQAMEAGKLGWHDFTVQHNDHRLPLPRLVFFIAAWLSHWDTRVEMYLTVLALGAAAAALWKLLEVTGWKANSATYALFAVIGLLVLDPVQEQNLLGGFQFHFVLPLTLILAGYWAAMALRQPLNYIVTAAIASAATFSMAVGLGAWPLIFPLLLLRERKAGWWKWMSGWFLAFAVNAALFFTDYRRPEGTLGALFQHPGAAFHYLLVLLGSPFCWGVAFNRTSVAATVGGAFLIGLSLALGTLWTWRKDAALFRRALPWIMVSGVGILMALLTTAGRFHFGDDQALENRYVPYVVTVPIGVLVFVAIAAERSFRKAIFWPGFTLSGGVGILLFLYGTSYIFHLDALPFFKHWRLMSKAVVQTFDFVDSSRYVRRVSPEPERLSATIHSLDRLGYLNPPILKSRNIAEISQSSPPGGVHYGAVEKSAQQGDRFAVSGWALLPDRLELADAVLLTYDDAEGRPLIFAIAEVIESRPDIAANTHQEEFTNCGFNCIFPLSILPPGASKISAWAYDAESRHAWRLPGYAVAHR